MPKLQVTGPPYVPRVKDIVLVQVPRGPRPLLFQAVHTWGSVKQAKINVVGKSISDGNAVHLIWKPSTGWGMYFVNAYVYDLTVTLYERPNPDQGW